MIAMNWEVGLNGCVLAAVETIGFCLLHTVWQFLLIACLIKWCLFLIPGSRSSLRYWVLGAGLMACTAMPCLTWMYVDGTAESGRIQVATATTIEDKLDSPDFNAESEVRLIEYRSGVPQRESDLDRRSALMPTPLTQSGETPGWLGIDWERWVRRGYAAQRSLGQAMPMLVVIWAVGVLIFTLRPILGWIELRRLCRSAVPVSEAMQRSFHDLVQRHLMIRPVQLLQSDQIVTPMVIGFFRPMVLLPVACIAQLSTHQLEAILLHELAHLKRYDDWVNLMQIVVETLFFYHPVIWWLSAQMRAEREVCCDSLATTADPEMGAHLAKALLTLEEGAELWQPALHASDGQLLSRVRRLLGQPSPPLGWTSVIAPSIVLLMMLLVWNSSVLHAGDVITTERLWVGDKLMSDGSLRPTVPAQPAASSLASASRSSAAKRDSSPRIALDEPVDFASIAELQQLPESTTSLAYSGSNQNAFDDSMASLIAIRFSGLRYLDVPFARSLTDRGLIELASLDRLQALRLRFANQLTRQSAAELAASSLVSLDVSYCPALTDDAGVAALLANRSLKNLILLRHSANGLTDAGRLALIEHPGLERVLVNPMQHPFVDHLDQLRFEPKANSNQGFVCPFEDRRHYRFLVVPDQPGTNHWVTLSHLGHTETQNQRFLNEQVYRERKAWFEKQGVRGSWTAIANGVSFTDFPTLERVCQSVDQQFPNAKHRFVFRAGIDDVPQEFAYSPWVTGQSNWWQLGRQFLQKHQIQISTSQWGANGRVISSSGGKVNLRLIGWDQAEDRLPEVTRQALGSAMSAHQLAITESDVERLGLQRYEVPGKVSCKTYSAMFRRVLVQSAIPGLDVHQQVVAFVAPSALVNRDPPVASEAVQLMTVDSDGPQKWIVQGRVTDAQGQGLAGATIRVHTGIGSLQQVGTGVSDGAGRYRVEFSGGVSLASLGSGPKLQAATIRVFLEGHAEKNLCRHGDRLMATHEPFDMSAWGKKDEVARKLILPGKPVTLNFSMVKAGALEGYLTDSEGRGYARQSLSLTGPELPPSSSVLAQVETSAEGKFRFNNVPLGKQWRFELTDPATGKLARSQSLQIEDPQFLKRWVRLQASTSSPTGVELELIELDSQTEQKMRVLSRNRVFGEPVPKQDSRDLAWGATQTGLRAALVGFAKSHALGSVVEPQVVIQNTSQQVIQFESTRWRQEDQPRLWVEGEPATLTRTWYSGFPRVQLIELKPGQETTLQLAGVQFGDTTSTKLAAYRFYRFPKVQGACELDFSLKVPDVGSAQKGHWQGTLRTGKAKFALTPGTED